MENVRQSWTRCKALRGSIWRGAQFSGIASLGSGKLAIRACGRDVAMDDPCPYPPGVPLPLAYAAKD